MTRIFDGEKFAEINAADFSISGDDISKQVLGFDDAFPGDEYESYHVDSVDDTIDMLEDWSKKAKIRRIEVYTFTEKQMYIRKMMKDIGLNEISYSLDNCFVASSGNVIYDNGLFTTFEIRKKDNGEIEERRSFDGDDWTAWEPVQGGKA